MQLQILHPRVAHRDCEYCQKYQHDESTGKPIVNKSTGQPYPRYKNTPPPCRVDGCAKGTPEAPKSLSDRNRRAHIHYLTCRAVGRFPQDPIVERNAMLFRAIEDAEEKRQKQRLEASLMQAVAR